MQESLVSINNGVYWLRSAPRGVGTGLSTEAVARGNEGFSAARDEVDEIKLCSDNAQGFLFFFLSHKSQGFQS